MTDFPRLLWADLHNHNEVGYAKGTLERSYRIAENTLDVYAFSVHGYWPDPPDNDPKMVDYHTKAFSAISAAFPQVISEANRRYVPGRFVTFIAYEWHSTLCGDYVVIFPGDSGDLHRAQSLEELQRFVRERGALMIPHHVGYRRGWRGLDWARVDSSLTPLVEVFSEHGNSFAREDVWPMTAHSMGGVTDSQTILTQLQRGAHFGFTAGTDTHFGYPGSYGEGITGIYCRELTREAVFAALRQRHTVAGTGDRIELQVDAAGALPGDILPASAPRRFSFHVNPLAPLDYVEVIKNGRRAQLWPAGLSPVSAVEDRQEFLVRIDWGWGRMEHADETNWKIRIGIKNGELTRVTSCMGGGAGGVDRLNLIESHSPHEVSIASVTSRRNPLPINGVVLRIAGTPATTIECGASGSVQGENGECRVSASLAELRRDDVWGMLLDRFSSPRLRLGRAHTVAGLSLAGTYEDPAPGPHDTYVFKARQANGHTVWASPYLFR